MNMFDSDHDYVRDYIDRWNHEVKRTKVAMIALGAVLALAGVAAFAAPLGTYGVLQLVVACVLAVHGVGQIASWARTPEFFRNGATLAAGMLNVALGALFVILPSTFMAGTLVYLLAFLLIVTGIERVSFARQMRFYAIPAASTGTATGVLNIIIGVAFLFLPLATSIMLSYIVAAYLIIAGITLVAEGVSIRSIEP